MPLTLRVDVDKPFGRSNFIEKVRSKLCEDYWYPSMLSKGYLNHLKVLLQFLSENEISAHIYFRQCTLPPKSWLNESLLNGHKLGLHAENTRDFETFKREFERVQAHFSPYKISSFTKHGSGQLKLGKNHYASYEPDRYLEWSELLDVPYLFGNGIVSDVNEFAVHNHFCPSMFWINETHRDCERFSLQWAIDIAKKYNVIVIIHPANFLASGQVNRDMKKLVLLALQHNVPWITINQ